MKYNIVLVSDESYVPHAATMLCSLFENNGALEFDVYYLTDKLTEDSTTRLQSLCQQYGNELYVIDCPLMPMTDLPVGQWNTIMYFKLYMPSMLPTTVERCLFLDVDLLVLDNIIDLYNINLGANVFAAAEDIPDCLLHKTRLGLRAQDAYINSGVMVCNISAWREMEARRPLFDFASSVSNVIINEQDVIAMYFRGKIDILPIRWNMVTFYYMRRPKIFEKYLPQLKDAKHNPGIVHFCCPIKPWFRDCNHPLGKLYTKYRNKTSWRSTSRYPVYERLDIIRRFNKNIKNLLNRLDIIRHPDFLSK